MAILESQAQIIIGSAHKKGIPLSTIKRKFNLHGKNMVDMTKVNFVKALKWIELQEYK